ncbi:MAG: hypothetical protein DIZ77_09235 [endosymbiont of Seepiophila jonesi]|uniref:Uncharacterized protein n=1 Tax=endosymbiont of Lamellibrachia luymesi TaxID=2200907 RepID=A0A370DB66_9GAMM|nr:MAG: hypothetical protein DIZ79_18125 [endosymbiont of Lamellibrachia luymesi]RDH92099.1 MAG: hypothetical protein DIZ77_09235 [endosymbiont of Seepiophila jonesi]
MIHYSSETLIIDEWKEDRSFNLQQIRVGDELEIDVTQDASGNLFAVKLVRKSGTEVETDDEDQAEGSGDEGTEGDDTDEEGSSENENDDGNTGVPGITDSHRVLAFNDLGMHCADLDYTTFVVLPPFNVIRSQVIERGATPRILSSAEVDVAYKAQMDAAGSINTTSQNLPGSVQKTNFWDINPASGNTYVFDLFGGNPRLMSDSWARACLASMHPIPPMRINPSGTTTQTTPGSQRTAFRSCRWMTPDRPMPTH